MNKKNVMVSNIMLLMASFIWGSSFVAQSVGMDYVGPFTFNAARNIIGGIVLIPVVFFLDKLKSKNENLTDSQESMSMASNKQSNKTLIIGGFLCGLALFGGITFQQFGIVHTTAGKSGFITALYIVIVPVLGIFMKKKVPSIVWVSVVIAVAGFYFLTIKEGLSIGIGDFLTLICAFFFSFHILIIDYFSPKVDGVKLSCIQFFVCGFISLIAMFIFENPNISSLLMAWAPVLYAGVLSCGVAYTLQVLAQKNTDPFVAALLLSTESVFAVVAGLLLLDQTMTLRESFGCLLVLFAITITQLPSRKTSKKTSNSFK